MVSPPIARMVVGVKFSPNGVLSSVLFEHRSLFVLLSMQEDPEMNILVLRCSSRGLVPEMMC